MSSSRPSLEATFAQISTVAYIIDVMGRNMQKMNQLVINEH